MTYMPNRDQVLEALKVVIDPELRRDIVELEMVRSIEFQEGGVVDVMVSLTTAGCPIRNHFETAVTDAVGKLEGV
jgi:ATP-binding protein involved in chromosome partitioning